MLPFLHTAETLVLLALSIALGFVCWKQFRLRHKMERRCESLVREKQIVLDFLHNLGETLLSTTDIEEILQRLLRATITATQASSGAIFLVDETHKQLHAAVVEGLFPPPLPPPEVIGTKMLTRADYIQQIIMGMPIPIGEGLLGQVARDGHPVLIRDGASDPRCPEIENREFPRIQTMIIAPLRDRDEVFGVMAVANTTTGGPFLSGDQSLFNALADQIALAYRNATLQAVKTQQRQMERELQMAGDIQRILLPSQHPDVRGFDVAAINVPALKLGGDYFDFIPLGEQRLGVVIADVSGKGIPGGLIMAMCRSVIRANALKDSPADQVLKRVNRLLHPDLKEDMFITLSYLIVDSGKRTVEIARAGHEPVLIISKDGKQLRRVDGRGIALGLDGGDLFDMMIETNTVTLDPGDTIVLYTDGVTDAESPTGTQFGRDQLCATLADLAGGTSEDFVNGIMDRIDNFAGTGPAKDDITLVAVKVD